MKQFFLTAILVFVAWIGPSNQAEAGPKAYTLTVPAEAPEGVLLDLEPGRWKAEIAGGAVTLWYPIYSCLVTFTFKRPLLSLWSKSLTQKRTLDGSSKLKESDVP